jgi:hypothetical protein
VSAQCYVVSVIWYNVWRYELTCDRPELTQGSVSVLQLVMTMSMHCMQASLICISCVRQMLLTHQSNRLSVLDCGVLIALLCDSFIFSQHHQMQDGVTEETAQFAFTEAIKFRAKQEEKDRRVEEARRAALQRQLKGAQKAEAERVRAEEEAKVRYGCFVTVL